VLLKRFFNPHFIPKHHIAKPYLSKMINIFKISFLLIVLGCNQSKTSSANQVELTNVIDTISNIDNDKIDVFTRVKKTNGVFAIDDLSDEFCLVFGIGKHESINSWNDQNIDSLKGFIVNPTYQEFINLRELRAQRVHIASKSDSLPICHFQNSLLIPFKSNEDISHLTIWRKMSKDSIKFDKILQPSIERSYASIVSIDSHELKGEEYLSIYLEGGEGGGNWDEQIIAKFNGKDKFEIIASEIIGYCHDCGDWAKIKLTVNSDNFEMTEIRDSMKIVDGNWVRVSRKVLEKKKVSI